MIFLPFLNWSNQLQLPAISKRFDVEQRGWLRWITNSMQFYSFFLLLKSGEYYRKYGLKRLMRYI